MQEGSIDIAAPALPQGALSPAPSPRVRHLLTVAREEFVSRGFDAVSIESIARAGGVSKETIYRHFADKEALFRAAVVAAGEDFTARTEAVHDRAANPEVELAGLARAILDTALDQGMFSALWLAAGVAGRMPDLAAQLQEGQWRRLEPVRRALASHAAAQGLEGDVPRDLALDFGSLAVEGPAVLMGFPPLPAEQRDRVAARVAGLFAYGIEGVIAGQETKRAPIATSSPPPPPVLATAPHIAGLLDVAARHFLALGYDGANLDAIGAEARVGRGTLYRHFGSKTGLFAAAMRSAAAACGSTDGTEPATQGADGADALARFLDRALVALGSARSIQLHRVVISQSRRDPALARDVFTLVRAPWAEPLAAWLASLGLREDPAWYARQALVIALRGNRLLASDRPMPPEERQTQARRSATLFLRGFGALL